MRFTRVEKNKSFLTLLFDLLKRFLYLQYNNLKKINKMNTHTQEEEFRSDFVLNSIINDVEIKGQRKTIAYFGAKAEMKRKNEFKLSTIRVRNSSTQNY